MSKALVKSTSLVSAMTFISRVLGFARDMIVAQVFGVNAAVDAFNVAFKLPNFMRNLFAEGSFSQAFVPVLSEYRQKRTHAETLQFISYVAGCLGLILSIITFLGVVGSPIVVKIFNPGLDPYRFELASYMLKITFPYLMLISLTALCAGVLNTYGVYAIPSFTPALLNVCLIATAFGITHYFKVPIEAQAWGVLLGGFVQFFFQIPFLKRIGLLPMPRVNWKDPGVNRVLKLMLPSLLGASVGQVSILINTVFASFLRVGSISWLYYSERLAYFPLGVFGVALLTIVLPQLSSQHAKQSNDGFSSILNWGIRCNLLIGIPASLTMLLLSGPLVTTLFAHGKFTAFDAVMTQRSVITYAVGLQSFMLVKILAAAFYSKQDTKTPVKIALVTVVINIILNAALIVPLAHAGLALASSLGSWFNSFILIYVLHKRNIYRFQSGWGIFTIRLLVANLILGLFLWWQGGDLTTWLSWHWTQRLLHLTYLGVSSIALYVISLGILGIRFSDFRAKFT